MRHTNYCFYCTRPKFDLAIHLPLLLSWCFSTYQDRLDTSAHCASCEVKWRSQCHQWLLLVESDVAHTNLALHEKKMYQSIVRNLSCIWSQTSISFLMNSVYHWEHTVSIPLNWRGRGGGGSLTNCQTLLHL